MATPAQDPFAASRRALRLKTILLTSGVTVALLAGIFLYTRSRQSLLLVTAPADSAVTLNSASVASTYKNQQFRIRVIAGQYRLQVTRPNYLPYVQDVNIPVGKTVALRPVFTLMPVTSEQAGGEGIAFVRPLPDRNLVFYLGDGGTRLYRVDTTTQTQVAVSERSLARITGVEWPDRADVAIITRADGVYLFEVPKFDFQNQRFERVAGTEIVSPVWDPTGERVASALFLPNGERSLILSDKRFTSLDRRADLSGFTNPRLTWSPDGRFIAVLNRSSDPAQNNVWILTLASGDFVPVTEGGDVVAVSFSPDEASLLLEKRGQRLVTHQLVDGTQHTLATPGTVQTTAWKDGDTLYLPEPGSNVLIKTTRAGTESRVPYTLPATRALLGLTYFDDPESLIFYTEQAVYTVSVAE